MSAREVAAEVLLFSGVAVALVSCLGVALMRGPFDRLHYVGPLGLAALLIAVATLVEDGFSLIADKALALALFVVITAPVLAHGTARAARVEARDDWRIGDDEEIEVDRR